MRFRPQESVKSQLYLTVPRLCGKWIVFQGFAHNSYFPVFVFLEWHCRMNSIVSSAAASAVRESGLYPSGIGVVNRVRIARASSVGEFGGTSILSPTCSISGIPPTLLATQGVRHADASKRTVGTPSEWLGRTNRSTAWNQFGNRS